MARTIRRAPTPQERKRNLLYRILWIIGGLVVIVIAAGILVLIQIGGTPPLPPDVARGIDEGAQTSDAIRDVAGLRQAISVGQRRPINVDLTNADIAALIGEVGAGDEQVQGLEVLLGSGRALVRGKVSHKDRSYNMQATFTVVPKNGSIKATLGDLWIGSFRAPGALKTQLQDSIDANLAKHTPQSLGIYVEQIQMRPGHAVLEGHTLER